MVTICVAIAQYRGAATLTPAELSAGWETNPHGGGFAYVNSDGFIETFKSMDKSKFIDAYLAAHAEYGDSSAFIVHMRIATHGKIDISTAHPFTVRLQGEGEMVFAHNGIISCVDHLTNNDTSDTMAFRDSVLEYLDDNWLDNDVLVDMIDDLIGWSKLVFLTTSPKLEHELYIVNEKAGHWTDAGWFSNKSCVVTSTPVKYDMDSWDDYDVPPTNRHSMPIKDKSTFAQWLGAPDIMYTPHEMATASSDMWQSMVLEAISKGAECVNCMGKDYCYCDDMCAFCFEEWVSCQCYPDDSMFTSIREFMKEIEVDSMQECIIEAEVVEEDEKPFTPRSLAQVHDALLEDTMRGYTDDGGVVEQSWWNNDKLNQVIRYEDGTRIVRTNGKVTL